MIQDVEELWCLALGPGLKLIAVQMIFRGTVDACTVHPRDIFRFACLQNASQLIIAHNHPSGDHEPSLQDLEFTQKLIEVGWAIEIPIVDHLIITDSTYSSMAESRILPFFDRRN
jgi:DNA repair protein RadC